MTLLQVSSIHYTQCNLHDACIETEEARVKRTGMRYVYQYNQHRGRCHDPKTPEYGYSFYHSTHVGAVVIHKCKSGYKLVGSKIRTCRQTGYWYPGIPKCVGKYHTVHHAFSYCKGNNNGACYCNHCINTCRRDCAHCNTQYFRAQGIAAFVLVHKDVDYCHRYKKKNVNH